MFARNELELQKMSDIQANDGALILINHQIILRILDHEPT